MTAQPAELQRRIGLWQGVALYVSAVLGAGVLVLPGQVASTAGPASLVAWGFSCLLGLVLALTFASLATAMPGAGGVATFTTAAFGPSAGGVVGWWYLLAGSLGQTIVPLTGGYYVAAAFGLGSGASVVVAVGILSAAVAANVAGFKVSSRAQVVLAAGVALVLVAAVVSAVPAMDLARLEPFAPAGVSAVGQSVVVLFFAFAGWEAVAHLSGEFTDPDRGLRRATLITVVVVSVLYLAIAAAVVLTGTYGSAQTDRLSVGLLLSRGGGQGALIATAIAALVISLGTTNAFVASISRLAYSLGREGWLPAPLGRLNDRGVPARGVVLVGAIGAAGLLAVWLLGWGTEDIVVIPATLVIVTYLVGTAAGVRLLRGRDRAAAGLALALTLSTVPFAAKHVLIPVVVACVALTYRHLTARVSTPQ